LTAAGVALGRWQSFDMPSSYRQLWGLWGPGWWWSLAEARTSALSLLALGLVLYIYRAQLKPAGFSGRCQHAVFLYKLAGPYHLLSTPVAVTTPRCPQSGCDGLSHFKEDTGEPYVPEFNLIACKKTWLDMLVGAGGKPTPCQTSQQPGSLHCSSESIIPLSHGGRLNW